MCILLLEGGKGERLELIRITPLSGRSMVLQPYMDMWHGGLDKYLRDSVCMED